MARKTISICLLFFVPLVFFSGAYDLPLLGADLLPFDPTGDESSSSMSCDEDIDDDFFIKDGTNSFQPKVLSLLFHTFPEVFVSQGFVSSIFRPPTSIL